KAHGVVAVRFHLVTGEAVSIATERYSKMGTSSSALTLKAEIRRSPATRSASRPGCSTVSTTGDHVRGDYTCRDYRPQVETRGDFARIVGPSPPETALFVDKVSSFLQVLILLCTCRGSAAYDLTGLHITKRVENFWHEWTEF